MSAPIPYLSPAEAALRLGVSAKALRLYEQRGLVNPARTAAGWRAYGPGDIEHAAEIVALRALGLSLSEIGHVQGGDPSALGRALRRHEAALLAEGTRLAERLSRLRDVAMALDTGMKPTFGALAGLVGPMRGPSVAFDLPWPWGGERFELNDIRPLTYITGPLGSGKTRLARLLAETLPGGVFAGPERLDPAGLADAHARLDADPALAERTGARLSRLAGDGATISDALVALAVALDASGTPMIVVDMVEDGLDAATQEAVATDLRRRGPDAPPLFLLTRSSAILDLAGAGADEAILYCPANHSPPMRVAACPGAAGYEAVATCLAAPEVRSRTAGMVAMRLARG